MKHLRHFLAQFRPHTFGGWVMLALLALLAWLSPFLLVGFLIVIESIDRGTRGTATTRQLRRVKLVQLLMMFIATLFLLLAVAFPWHGPLAIVAIGLLAALVGFCMLLYVPLSPEMAASCERDRAELRSKGLGVENENSMVHPALWDIR